MINFFHFITSSMKICAHNKPKNTFSTFFLHLQARNKPADGSIVGQKLQAGQRTPTHGPKGKSTQKATGQKGQPIKQAPAKVAAAAVIKTTKKTKKGKHHQHDLIVTIDLVRTLCVL